MADNEITNNIRAQHTTIGEMSGHKFSYLTDVDDDNATTGPAHFSTHFLRRKDVRLGSDSESCFNMTRSQISKIINEQARDQSATMVELYRNVQVPVHTKSSVASISPPISSDLQLMTLAQMGFNSDSIKFSSGKPPAKADLYALLRVLLEKRLQPNLNVKIGDESFHVHLVVLQCYSQMFMELTTEMFVELPKERVTPLAFKIIYDWMIGDQPNLQRCGLLEVLNAATFLNIQQLVSQCWACLDDTRINEDKAFLLYWESKKHKLDSCHLPMLSRISKFFLYLVACKEFLELKPNEIHTILSSNRIGVNSEMETFMAAVRWLSYKWEERKKQVVSLMHCIRFSLVPPWLLVTLQRSDSSRDVHRVVTIARVRELIHDGIAYTSTRLFYGADRSGFIGYLQQSKMLPPKARVWIYDQSCLYHHRLRCPNMGGFSYHAFINYLQMLLTKDRFYWQSFETAEFGQCRCGVHINKIDEIDPTIQFDEVTNDDVINDKTDNDNAFGCKSDDGLNSFRRNCKEEKNAVVSSDVDIDAYNPKSDSTEVEVDQQALGKVKTYYDKVEKPGL